jgi:hypothetical protein
MLAPEFLCTLNLTPDKILSTKIFILLLQIVLGRLHTKTTTKISLTYETVHIIFSIPTFVDARLVKNMTAACKLQKCLLLEYS